MNWAKVLGYDLGNITFFDPKTKEAYWQKATGDIPESPLTQFCVVGFRNSQGGYKM
jgi:hypothetical protein